MEMIRNPLLASVPCGRVLGVPFRVSLIAICVLLALLFGQSVDRSISDQPTVRSAVPRATSDMRLESAGTLDGRLSQPPFAAEVQPTASDFDQDLVGQDLVPSTVAEGETPGDATGSAPAGSLRDSGAPPAADVGSREVDGSEGPSEGQGDGDRSSSLAFVAAPQTAVVESGRSGAVTAGSSRPVGRTADRLAVGLFLALALFGSSLLHEAAEVIIANRAGARVTSLILLPVGGRTTVRAADPLTDMVVAAIGPVVHLALCLIALPSVIASGNTGVFSLLALPSVTFQDHWFANAGLLLFSLNWKLMFINLLPFIPFDGGRFIAAWRRSAKNVEVESATNVLAWSRFGLLGGLLLLAFALTMSNAWIAAIGGLLMAWSCVDGLLVTSFDSDDESVLGYDFSAGYTSLEREEDVQSIPREKTLGPLARWKAKKGAQKRQREREEREWAEQELDRLLDKVSKVGMDGLTSDEKKTLQQVSNRYRQ